MRVSHIAPAAIALAKMGSFQTDPSVCHRTVCWQALPAAGTVIEPLHKLLSAADTYCDIFWNQPGGRATAGSASMINLGAWNSAEDCFAAFDCLLRQCYGRSNGGLTRDFGGHIAVAFSNSEILDMEI